MSYEDDSSYISVKDILQWIILAIAVLLAIIGIIVLLIWGFKSFGRAQAIADANNNAQIARINAANESEVNRLRIASQEQKVKIAEQDAEIRKKNAQGIRAAQDEIAKTLTPLYVQFEMTEALKEIAQSGKNNTVIYIPTGENGLPIVQPSK